MRILLLGCPGAGKGTQARTLANRYNIPLIATGDMLRTVAESGAELGLKVRRIMESGALVPDEIIVKLVKERLEQKDCERGYLLDGFPRTIFQAETLHQSGVIIDYVIEIFVPDDEIVERLSGRRIHLTSGRTYHLIYNPPKTVEVDDLTGEPLIHRDDDEEQTIRHRLSVYHEKTEPLINYYKKTPGPKYVRVDGVGKIEQIYERILAAITKSQS